MQSGLGILLLQTLAEFSNVAIRKAGIPIDDIRATIDAWRAVLPVHAAKEGARPRAPTVPASDGRNRCEGSGGDVRPLRVWKQLLGLRRTVIERVDFDEAEGALVVSVRPRAKELDRCPHCRRRC